MNSKGDESGKTEDSKNQDCVVDRDKLESHLNVTEETKEYNVEDEEAWNGSVRMSRRWKIYLIVSTVLFASLVVLGLMLWYLKVLPEDVEYVSVAFGRAKCLSLRIPLCHKYRIPYSYTMYPNSLGHLTQSDAGEAILRYEPLISVKCYALLPLFLCTLHAPKCIDKNRSVPPCRSLCEETVRKCEFFLKVFTVDWPSGMECQELPDSPDPEICVGDQEMRNLERKSKACLHGFRCDRKLCIPKNWVCDGYVDCKDMSDERDCNGCRSDQYYCGHGVCIDKSKFCDGVQDCPDDREERKCLRLDQRQGYHGEGLLQAYNLAENTWRPVCGERWETPTMSSKACSIIGYKSVNETRIRDVASAEGRVAIGTIADIKTSRKSLFTRSQCKGGDPVNVYLKCQNFECGKSANMVGKASWRIVGGQPADPGTWPWLVALHGGPDEVFFCGGVLISDWWVLSAAHCVGNQSDTSGWILKLGMTRRSSHPESTQKRGVSEIVRHPDFSSASFYGNDIVLIRLDRPVTFDAMLRPICLPRPNLPSQDLKSCSVIGWGKPVHDDEADYEEEIHQVEIPIVDFETCSKWYLEQEVVISETMLCAGYEEGKKDACQGDSGGPLICKGDDHWFVAGVVSWGIKCAQPNLPGIYTNVPLYVDWIMNSTRQSQYPIES